MSKYLKIMVALLAAAAIATPAFAIDGSVSGFLNVRGVALDNMDGDDSKDDNGRYVDQRMRLATTAALNENVKAVFQFETDNVWGSTAGLKEIGAMGTDAKGQIEVKHSYLDFNVPELNANFKAGSQYFKLGRGLIIADDAAGLFVRATCPVMPDNSLGLFWVKPQEGNVNNDEADSDYYHIQYDMKVAGAKVAPYFGFFDMTGDDEAFFLGVDYDGQVGDIALSATAIANDWEANGGDGSGFALWGKGAYKMGASTYSLEAAYYGDEDNGGEFMTLSQGGATGAFNNFSEIITGGQFDSRSTTAAQTVAGKTGAAAPYGANYLYAKLGAEHKYNDKSKVSAYYIYSKQAEDVGGGPAAVTFGNEIDAYYDYTVVPGLTLTVGGGYLLADDEFGAGDDAWKLGSGLLYKF